MIYTEGGIFHVYNRGCNKELIFFEEQNYLDLLNRIKKSNRLENFGIIAYCLMPNHYHFLIQQKTELSVSNWLGYIFNGYAQSINFLQDRSGTLFEGRAKPKLIDKEDYLIRLVLYIHNNPVKAGLVDDPADWKYSNYLEWIEKRNGKLIDRNFIFEHFDSYQDYEKLMDEYSKQLMGLDDLSDCLLDN
ncbi:MAG: transposase [Candidatus Cloacimonetes bacterium]|nr:transposase [Candidatus Cloacimonadota bacterium]